MAHDCRGRNAEGFSLRPSRPPPSDCSWPRCRTAHRALGIVRACRGKGAVAHQAVSLLGFSYIGMVLAMRSNKEISPSYPVCPVFPAKQAGQSLLLDTSVIIDGRIVDLSNPTFWKVDRGAAFVLRELMQLADSNDAIKRARGRRGLEILNRIQHNTRNEVKIHDAIFPRKREWMPSSSGWRGI